MEASAEIFGSGARIIFLFLKDDFMILKDDFMILRAPNLEQVLDLRMLFLRSSDN
jgi:hypothetical protein